MAYKTQLLTNDAYGFPRGKMRRIKPVVLAVIHQTGNSSNLGLTAADNEQHYANRVGSGGPSAHLYLGRSAAADSVWALSFMSYAAWSNGDLVNPVVTNPGVAKLIALKARGYNANEGVYLEIECIADPGANPVTTWQREELARHIANASIKTGLPINSSTVLGHYQINTVDRARCPFPVATRAKLLAALIARANAIKTAKLAPPPPVVVPPPPPVIVPPVVVTYTKAQYDAVVAQLMASQDVATANAHLAQMANEKLISAKAIAGQIQKL